MSRIQKEEREWKKRLKYLPSFYKSINFSPYSFNYSLFLSFFNQHFRLSVAQKSLRKSSHLAKSIKKPEGGSSRSIISVTRGLVVQLMIQKTREIRSFYISKWVMFLQQLWRDLFCSPWLHLLSACINPRGP